MKTVVFVSCGAVALIVCLLEATSSYTDSEWTLRNKRKRIESFLNSLMKR